MKYHNSMNKVCRLVWSQVQSTWVVATGDTKGRSKSKSVFKPKLMAVTLALLSPAAFAAPMDGQISAGSGGIAQAGTTTTITQQSQNLAINWQSFDIGSNEAVHFNQPNSAAIALNRVLGQNPSQILGSLSANGQVFVLNPNGVLFGNAAQVNVGGLVASTLNISDDDFMAGNNVFSNGGIAGGNVDNQGALNAANGGYIALISPTVTNSGSISAPQGTVALAAGNSVTLNLNNGSLLGYTIDTGTASALVSNGGMIAANGGQVLVTARGADALSVAVVNNTGIIEARTVQNVGGVIKLMADMQIGQVNVGGTLDASAPDGGDGGFIETSAATVGVADNAVVTTNSALGQTGNWLIDPADFTIAATSGDISGATLSSNLGSTGVTILSNSGATGVNGDVNVNDVVSWSANKLTLNAQRNININANLNGSGTASLALEYGQGAVAAGNTGNYQLASNARIDLPSGLNFSTRLGSDGIAKAYTVINSLGIAGDISGATLQGMNGNRAGNYALGSNIDASLTSGWNAGAGFAPVGASTTQFTGNFDGLGHTISNLVINRPTTNDVGLFGYIATGSTVRNVGLVNGSMSGKNSGGLIGQSWGAVSNSYFIGSVAGNSNNVGGLVGLNGGSVSSSYATGSVSSVTGTNNVGGLVGYNIAGIISNSYASVSVGGNNNVGGLVGLNNAGTISTSYATGSVTGSSLLGGLVGNNSLGAITDTYATGNVSGGAGNSNVGGLLGQNSGTVSTSYAIGSVSGALSVGGLAGSNNGTISDSYWDNQLSGQLSGIGAGVAAGATGLTTAQSMQQSSYIGFDFTNVWRIYDGHTTPLLRSFLKQLTITASDVTKVYDATVAGLTGATYSDPAAAGSVNLYGLANPYGAVNKNNVGVYAADLWSDQQGYDITLVGGQLTVTPANLEVSVTAANKVYDATTSATLSGAAITALGADVVSLDGTGSGVFADKNAGTGKTVNISGNFSISGADAGNYNLIQPIAATADITRLDLALSGITAANKVYDATRTATLGGAASVTALGLDVVSVSGSGSGLFADKNAGTGKTVTVNIGGYNLSGMDAGNYNLIQPSGLTADITPRALTITAFAASRVYNAGTAATISSFANNRLYGDILTTGYGSAAFEDKNVGTGKTVNVSGITLGGTDARNYTYNTTATATANITKLNVALNGVTAANKVYDATTVATIGGTAYVNKLGTDLVAVEGSGSGTFIDKNVGNYKAVTVNIGGYTLSGADAGNYNLTAPVGVTGSISKLALALTGTPIAASRVYDGTLTTSVSGATLDGVLGTDVVDLGGLFANKNVGVAKPVSLTLTGTDGGNYSAAPVAGLTADITARALDVSGTLIAASRVYDGTLNTTISGATLGGVVAGDSVILAGLFADKNVGTGKAVSIKTVGKDGSNYSITLVAGLIADVTPRDLTITAVGVNRVYNAGTAATVNFANNRVYGDILTTGYGSAAFEDKNVGTGKTVNVSGITLGGTDARNYSYNTTATTTASITKLNIALKGVTAANKVYDATTAATIGGAVYVSALGTDSVIVEGNGSGTFSSKNAGFAKIVDINVSGYTLSGTDAGNYNPIAPLDVRADIAKRALTTTGTPIAASRGYNGTLTTSVSGATLVGVLGSDVVDLGGLFANKNVGTGKAVSLTTIGTDGGNYTVAPVAGITADIMHLVLTVSGTPIAASRVYDGKVATAVDGATLDGVLAGDSVILSGNFADKNAGTGKAVSLALTGASGANYIITPVDGITADITPRALTITALAGGVASRVYNAGTATNVNFANDRLYGDILTTGYGSAAFEDKNVGTGKTVYVSGITLGGADARNYTYNTTATTTANITPLNIALKGVTAANKVYDATTAAAIGGAAYVTALGTDSVIVVGSGSGTFSNKNVGTGKPVAVDVSGYTLSGTDAGNYNLTAPVGVTGSISKLALSLTGTPIAASRVYDGTLTTSISGVTLSGILTGDALSMGGLFANKNAGVAKAVSLTLTGTDSGNYSVAPVAGITADITARALTVSGSPIAASRVYDGKVATAVSGATLDGVLAGDSVILNGNFADKNVGTGKAVSLALTGAAGGNYSITPVYGLTADITPRALTITAVGVNRVYNAGTAATVSLANNRVYGDILTTGYSAAFLDKNVGTGKTVNVSGITLGGTDARNYTYNTTATATANITKLNVALNGVTAANKVYDGTTDATIGGAAYVNKLGADSVIVEGSGSGVFFDKNVGNYKAVTVNIGGYTLSGADAGNYNLTAPYGVKANITPRTLTITADSMSMLYGSAIPGLTYTVGGLGLVGGDTYASVFTGGLTTLASSTSATGTYSITQGTLGTNSNYVITTYVNGVLTIQ